MAGKKCTSYITTRGLGDRMDKLSEKAMMSTDYLLFVSDILSNPLIMQLNNYRHHRFGTRLDHCIHVSYSCYTWFKKRKYIFLKDAVRGALLHDFFLYDSKFEKSIKKHLLHGLFHPKCALNQALKSFNLTKIEKNIILRHMFPITIVPPRYMASWLVVFYDKYWAIRELLNIK